MGLSGSGMARVDTTGKGARYQPMCGMTLRRMSAASASAMKMAAASALKASLVECDRGAMRSSCCAKGVGAGEERRGIEVARENPRGSRGAVAWVLVLWTRAARVRASRSGHQDTGATMHATTHATERGGVGQPHVYEAMGDRTGSQACSGFPVAGFQTLVFHLLFEQERT